MRFPGSLPCVLAMVALITAVGFIWFREQHDRVPFVYASDEERQNSVSVGVMRKGDVIAHVHVSTLLAMKAIYCQWSGGLSGADVMVWSGHAEAAREILEREAKKGLFRIWFPHGRSYKGPEDAIPQDLNITYNELIRRPEYGSNTPQGLALRNPEVMDAMGDYTYIEQATSRRREFLNHRRTLEVGYEFNLRLQRVPDDGSYRLLFIYIWNHGKNVYLANTRTRGLPRDDTLDLFLKRLRLRHNP